MPPDVVLIVVVVLVFPVALDVRVVRVIVVLPDNLLIVERLDPVLPDRKTVLVATATSQFSKSLKRSFALIF